MRMSVHINDSWMSKIKFLAIFSVGCFFVANAFADQSWSRSDFKRYLESTAENGESGQWCADFGVEVLDKKIKKKVTMVSVDDFYDKCVSYCSWHEKFISGKNIDCKNKCEECRFMVQVAEVAERARRQYYQYRQQQNAEKAENKQQGKQQTVVVRKCSFNNNVYNLGDIMDRFECLNLPNESKYNDVRTGKICMHKCLYNNENDTTEALILIESCPTDMVGVNLVKPDKYTPSATGYKKCEKASNIVRKCSFNNNVYNLGDIMERLECSNLPNESDYDGMRTGETCIKRCLRNNENDKMEAVISIESCPTDMVGVNLVKPDKYTPSATGYKRCETASNAEEKTDEQNQNVQDLEKAKKTLQTFFANAQKNASVWRTTDGSFNNARLASDLTAGVVLGTVGGVVSANIIKKNQLKKGYEVLHCTIGGQTIADFGDEFNIGFTQ